MNLQPTIPFFLALIMCNPGRAHAPKTAGAQAPAAACELQAKIFRNDRLGAPPSTVEYYRNPDTQRFVAVEVTPAEYHYVDSARENCSRMLFVDKKTKLARGDPKAAEKFSDCVNRELLDEKLRSQPFRFKTQMETSLRSKADPHGFGMWCNLGAQYGMSTALNSSTNIDSCVKISHELNSDFAKFYQCASINRNVGQYGLAGILIYGLLVAAPVAVTLPLEEGISGSSLTFAPISRFPVVAAVQADFNTAAAGYLAAALKACTGLQLFGIFSRKLTKEKCDDILKRLNDSKGTSACLDAIDGLMCAVTGLAAIELVVKGGEVLLKLR